MIVCLFDQTATEDLESAENELLLRFTAHLNNRKGYVSPSLYLSYTHARTHAHTHTHTLADSGPTFKQRNDHADASTQL